jgi:hypothetical protein
VLITTSGAVHSSVTLTYTVVRPPAANPLPDVKPALNSCLLAVAKSATSVQDVPFQDSV